jgi:hypothetical protein
MEGFQCFEQGVTEKFELVLGDRQEDSGIGTWFSFDTE